METRVETPKTGIGIDASGTREYLDGQESQERKSKGAMGRGEEGMIRGSKPVVSPGDEDDERAGKEKNKLGKFEELVVDGSESEGDEGG